MKKLFPWDMFKKLFEIDVTFLSLLVANSLLFWFLPFQNSRSSKHDYSAGFWLILKFWLLGPVFLWHVTVLSAFWLKPLNALGLASFQVVTFFASSLPVSWIVSPSLPFLMIWVQSLLGRMTYHSIFTYSVFFKIFILFFCISFFINFFQLIKATIFPKWMIHCFLTWFDTAIFT